MKIVDYVTLNLQIVQNVQIKFALLVLLLTFFQTMDANLVLKMRFIFQVQKLVQNATVLSKIVNLVHLKQCV